MSSAVNIVTGGSGFVGRHLVSRLAEGGEPVIALLRPTSEVPSEWPRSVRVVKIADFHPDTLLTAIDGALAGKATRAIYHLAAYGIRPTDRDLETIIDANTVLPARMVKVAAALRVPLVCAGSFAEYAPSATTCAAVSEVEPLETQRLYGSTKAAGALLASAAATSLGVPLRVLRFFQVYGPLEAAHRLMPSLISNLAAGRRVPLSNGTQIRDFLHVDDAVDAMLAACADAQKIATASVETLNVCTGYGRSVREFAEITAAAVGADAHLLDFGALPMRPDELPVQVGNPRRMETIIGWRAKRGLEDGIADTVRRSLRSAAV